MEQLIYTSVPLALIVIWMVLNKKSINKHIIGVFEDISEKDEVKSNVSLRDFYNYCHKHKIKNELNGKELLVIYNSKKIICSQDGDWRMGRTIINMKKK